jgi:hypothetical protein
MQVHLNIGVIIINVLDKRDLWIFNGSKRSFFFNNCPVMIVKILIVILPSELILIYPT